MMSSQDGTGWRRPRWPSRVPAARPARRHRCGRGHRRAGLVGLAVVDLVGGATGRASASSAAPRHRRRAGGPRPERLVDPVGAAAVDQPAGLVVGGGEHPAARVEGPGGDSRARPPRGSRAAPSTGRRRRARRPRSPSRPRPSARPAGRRRARRAPGRCRRSRGGPGACWACSTTCARSASTGAAYRSTRSVEMPAATATSSTLCPARTRAWISRGRELTLQGDLHLAWPGAVGGAQGSGEALVDGHAELPAVGVLEDQVAALRGDGDEPEVGHLWRLAVAASLIARASRSSDAVRLRRSLWPRARRGRAGAPGLSRSNCRFLARAPTAVDGQVAGSRR